MIDLLGRMRGGLDQKRRADLLRALRPRPAQEGPRLLQGQPAEGGADRRAGVRCRAAAARRAHLGPGPVDGGGVPGGDRRGGRAAATAPCCCPATSCPRSRRSATGSPSSGTGRSVRDRHPGRTAAPDPDVHPRRAGRPADGLADLPGVHDLQADNGNRVSFDVDADALDAALRQLTAVGVRTLVSQPPTLEELFLRHYDKTVPARRPGGGAMTTLTGTGSLIRLILRRDRLMMPLWIVIFPLIPVPPTSPRSPTCSRPPRPPDTPRQPRQRGLRRALRRAVTARASASSSPGGPGSCR